MFATQNNNRVDGSIAGRDIINPVTHHHHGEKKTQIGLLYERLAQEASQNQEMKEFVEELQHYMNRSAATIERSLSEKLAQTGRSDLIPTAESFKEIAFKKIVRFQSSSASQNIFAYVLSELHTKYLLHVRPLIAQGKGRAEVDSAMEMHVINPVSESMEPSTLGLTPHLILAFMFYLAGNCHVKWD